MDTVRIQKYGAHGPLGAINMIVVIESLREDDWKTGRLLREDLEVVALPCGNNLQVHDGIQLTDGPRMPPSPSREEIGPKPFTDAWRKAMSFQRGMSGCLENVSLAFAG
jgi:hypothetical protein